MQFILNVPESLKSKNIFIEFHVLQYAWQPLVSESWYLVTTWIDLTYIHFTMARGLIKSRGNDISRKGFRNL